MTRLTLLLLALLSSTSLAHAQDAEPPDGALIESVEITGLARDRLSPSLQHDIDELTGAALSRERISALAARIEDEHPDMLAAVRYIARPEGQARVVFLVGPISADEAISANINSRYTVERVSITGIDEGRLSASLRDDLHALVGRRLDNAEIIVLTNRLEAELPDYDVGHSVSRGGESGRLRVVFRARRTPSSWWIPYRPTPSKLLYHEDQGWSTVLNVQAAGESNLFTFGLVGWNNDDLIEEQSGFRAEFQTREAGSKRVGLGFDFVWLDQDWEAVTLETLALTPGSPRPYDNRLSVRPWVTFAFVPHLTLSAGFSASELDPLGGAGPSEHVNAGVATLGYRYSRKLEPASHDVDGTYQWTEAGGSIDSDYAYTRHFGQVRYQLSHGRNTFIASGLLGRISGRAPLFERFVLGDSSTLRGWDKYTLVPTGADRVFHQAVEYRYRSFAYFFDYGSVWSEGEAIKVRLATGLGFHSKHFFVTVGFPLNAGNLSGKFITGVRF
jgi:hypothetical protein